MKISTQNLTKVYCKNKPEEVEAIKDATLEIREGDFCLLTGPSGSGKTTLLSLLALLSRPTRGKIFYDVYMGAPIIRNFMLGWSAIYPNFPVPILISFGSILTLCAAAIIPLLVGTLIPAWKSAITEPDVVMRGS